jgi:hypothetical protein
MEKKIEIDEKAITAPTAPGWNEDASVQAEVDDYIQPEVPSKPSAQTTPTEPSENPVVTTDIAISRANADTDPARRTMKQRKSALDEYRRRYMPIPRIEDRKPVFVCRTTRDRLDRIVRLLGERGMSVSGLIENIARHHLDIHEADIEYWRKM